MKTLKEILHERHPKKFNCLYGNQVIELMQFVREQTLKECAEKVTLTQDEIMINSLDLNALDL